ncbi:MAG: hypothetical protein Q9195_007425 [Heterodermia aff. obscurata]
MMRNDDFFDPRPQPFYTFHDGLWHPSTSHKAPPTPILTSLPPIKLLTWNIDFQTPLPSARMHAALTHLQTLLPATSPPALILLQEMTPPDLHLIQSTPWIRTTFHLTDLSPTHWPDPTYGTLTLIDRRLPLRAVFRVHYPSNMGRDALFTDIEPAFRVCNTHLESLALHPPLRPAQLRVASRYLRDPTVDAGVIAGDFNAIEGFDVGLGEGNGLRDAYVGEEGAEEGWTWGMQSPGTRFPCCRMDKVLFCGSGVQVRGLERFGAGVSVEEEGERLFVTDHLGLMADVVFGEEDA